jgi:hypothetical protein
LGSGGADTFDGTCCKNNFEKVYFFRFFFNGYKYEHAFAMPAGGERQEGRFVPDPQLTRDRKLNRPRAFKITQQAPRGLPQVTSFETSILLSFLYSKLSNKVIFLNLVYSIA